MNDNDSNNGDNNNNDNDNDNDNDKHLQFMISIQYTINLARQVELPFAYALPCALVGWNMVL